jgi:hypothetical protein
MMRQHSRITGFETAPLEKIRDHGLDDVPGGGPRVHPQAVDELERCAARRRAHTPGIEAFLTSQ